MPAQDRRERVARNEASFREINETLEGGLRSAPREDGELSGFVCECGDRDCTALVHATLPQYQAVRADPMLFLICPGHEVPDVEDVVERGDRYAVVRKHEDARAIVEQTDPRG